ncbi:MORC family CW-type zinc finger protein 4 [Morphnus guianensis]
MQVHKSQSGEENELGTRLFLERDGHCLYTGRHRGGHLPPRRKCGPGRARPAGADAAVAVSAPATCRAAAPRPFSAVAEQLGKHRAPGGEGPSRAPPALPPDRAWCTLTESPWPAPGLQPRPQAGRGATSCGVFVKKNPRGFTKQPLCNARDAPRGCGDHGDLIRSCCSDCWLDLYSSPSAPWQRFPFVGVAAVPACFVRPGSSTAARLTAERDVPCRLEVQPACRLPSQTQPPIWKRGDNASHHSVTAKLFCIDVVELRGHLCLTFMDNKTGMTPRRLYRTLRNKDGKLELDFDTDKHIRIADFLADDGEIPSAKVLHSQKMVPEFPGPEMEYSLQAYCSILYLKPCMQVVLQQKKVNTQLITKSLANVEYDFYKPRFIISFLLPLGTLFPQQPQHTAGFQTNLTAGLRPAWSDA